MDLGGLLLITLLLAAIVAAVIAHLERKPESATADLDARTARIVRQSLAWAVALAPAVLVIYIASLFHPNLYLTGGGTSWMDWVITGALLLAAELGVIGGILLAWTRRDAKWLFVSLVALALTVVAFLLALAKGMSGLG